MVSSFCSRDVEVPHALSRVFLDGPHPLHGPDLSRFGSRMSPARAGKEATTGRDYKDLS